MSADMSYEDRAAAIDRINRAAKTARTYLRKASHFLLWSRSWGTGAVSPEYWSLLEQAITTATDIVEQLPDEFFATIDTVSFLDGEPFKYRLSDTAREDAEKLVGAINKRLEKVTKLSVIERLEAVEGRTPEEAALYLDKARELREAL